MAWIKTLKSQYILSIPVSHDLSKVTQVHAGPIPESKDMGKIFLKRSKIFENLDKNVEKEEVISCNNCLQ